MDERLFLTISRGQNAQSAQPLLVSDDRELISAIAREVAGRMGLEIVYDKDGMREFRILDGHPLLYVVPDDERGDDDV